MSLLGDSGCVSCVQETLRCRVSVLHVFPSEQMLVNGFEFSAICFPKPFFFMTLHLTCLPMLIFYKVCSGRVCMFLFTSVAAITKCLLKQEPLLLVCSFEQSPLGALISNIFFQVLLCHNQCKAISYRGACGRPKSLAYKG